MPETTTIDGTRRRGPWVVLAAIAVVFVLLGLAVVAWRQPSNVLVRQTAHLNGRSYVLWIERTPDGALACARERRAWGQGWSGELLLTESVEPITAPARIAIDRARGVAQYELDGAVVEVELGP